ncbi:hypothetical protein Dimus_025207, partial [Dionaea muscipula]
DHLSHHPPAIIINILAVALTRSVGDGDDDGKPQALRNVWTCGGWRRLSWVVVVEGSGDGLD